MKRLWKLFSGNVQTNRRTGAPGTLHSPERMQAILKRERLRSDRGSSKFGLLTITVSRTTSPRELSTLADAIQARVRVTDDAGFLESNCLGIVLPETPADGAWKLADDICSALPAEMRRPKCQVFIYPTDAEGELQLHTNGHHQTEHHGGDHRTGDHRNGDHRPRRELTKTDAVGQAAPMQALFFEPLPMWKRAIDILGAGALLIVVSPVMIVAALAIKLSSKGPVFFVQQRDGAAGRKFSLIKFRSMVVNAEDQKDKLRVLSEQDGPAFKLKNDPRVTRLGRLLRRTCIDELPQLFNVLKGDMSLVGPRPMCSKEARNCRPWEKRRLDVTPGLTCIWQVQGGTKVTFTEWMRMDLRYARKRSLWSDLRLMVLTVPSIIRRDGVY